MTQLRIVISYRRQDAPGGAGRLRDHLVEHFGRENVFLDIDTIEPGVPWRRAIEKTISKCDVLLPVIGMHWLSVTDAEGRRRIDQEDDVLRFEIASALKKPDVRLIPIQVHGAPMPSRAELPDDIAELTEYMSIRIDDDDFREDTQKLVRVLQRIRDEKDAGEGTATEQPPPPEPPPPERVRPGPRATEDDRRRRQMWAAYIGGGLLLVLVFLLLSPVGALISIGVALLVRTADVKLIRRDERRFWSPWILVISAAVALVLALVL